MIVVARLRISSLSHHDHGRASRRAAGPLVPGRLRRRALVGQKPWPGLRDRARIKRARSGGGRRARRCARPGRRAAPPPRRAARAAGRRRATPPRHAATESAAPPDIPRTRPGFPQPGPLERYAAGRSFLTALASGRAPRAAWSALPGPFWPDEIARAAATAAAAGRGALIVVPDARDLGLVDAALAGVLGPGPR